MRNALVAILTLGAQYGLQLRNELTRRSGGTLSVNSGQVYQTLDRLQRDGLLCPAGVTSDGLPLYDLTVTGRNFALEWLRKEAATVSKHPWETMLTQVLIAKSLPGVDTNDLIKSYRQYWVGAAKGTSVCESDLAGRLGSRAEKMQSEAALAWLDEAQKASDEGIKLASTRPARGRPRSVTPN